MTTSPGLRRIFKALVLNPVAPDRVESYDPGYLVITDDKIEKLTHEDPRRDFPSAEFIEAADKLIVPGLVDTHVHLPQYAIMGAGKGELLDWLNDYTYPEEARFADPEYAAQIAEKFFDEMLANGTTAAAIYSSIHEAATDVAFAAARRKGLRAFIGKVMMDRNSPESLLENTEDSIAASVRLFEKWDGADDGRLRYIFTPRFAAACSMELMKRAGEFARKHGAFVQSHLSENRDEVKLVRSLFPDLPSYAAVYDSAGLLGERTIVAHCIHLSSEEISLLARRRTKVAFCPYSNRTLRSGTMPYRKLRNAGLNIALGTDMAGGPSLSMFRQMGEALHSVAPAQALYLASLGGAEALGLADSIGNLAAGKDADFVIVSARKGGVADVLSNLCLFTDRQSIHEVYVRGRRVYF